MVCDGCLPEEGAVFLGEGGDALAVLEVSGGVDDAICNGDGGESFSYAFSIPEELGRGFFPVLDDAGLGRAAIPIWAAPLGPVFCLNEGRSCEGGEEKGG